MSIDGSLHPKSDWSRRDIAAASDLPMPPSAGDLVAEFGINLDTLRWCLNATTQIHGAYFTDPLTDNSLLSYPEVEAVREQFGHLTGIEIEIEYAQRLFRPDEAAQDELSRLISSYEAAERCGVAESTIRVWVHRKKLSPVEYRDGMAFFRQIDVHLVNEASKAKAAASPDNHSRAIPTGTKR